MATLYLSPSHTLMVLSVCVLLCHLCEDWFKCLWSEDMRDFIGSGLLCGLDLGLGLEVRIGFRLKIKRKRHNNVENEYRHKIFLLSSHFVSNSRPKTLKPPEGSEECFFLFNLGEVTLDEHAHLWEHQPKYTCKFWVCGCGFLYRNFTHMQQMHQSCCFTNANTLLCLCDGKIAGFMLHRVLCLSSSVSPPGPSVAAAAGCCGSPGRRPGPDQVQILAASGGRSDQSCWPGARSPRPGYPQISCTSTSSELLGFSARSLSFKYSWLPLQTNMAQDLRVLEFYFSLYPYIQSYDPKYGVKRLEVTFTVIKWSLVWNQSSYPHLYTPL